MMIYDFLSPPETCLTFGHLAFVSLRAPTGSSITIGCGGLRTFDDGRSALSRCLQNNWKKRPRGGWNEAEIRHLLFSFRNSTPLKVALPVCVLVVKPSLARLIRQKRCRESLYYIFSGEKSNQGLGWLN